MTGLIPKPPCLSQGTNTSIMCKIVISSLDHDTTRGLGHCLSWKHLMNKVVLYLVIAAQNLGLFNPFSVVHVCIPSPLDTFAQWLPEVAVSDR